MSDDGKSVFSRYIEEPKKEQRPVAIPRGPLLQPIVPPTDYKSPPSERLLDWLINFWPHDTVCARDLYRYGPCPLRDNRKDAIAQAEVLAANGWLSVAKSHRRDRKVWQIARGPGG